MSSSECNSSDVDANASVNSFGSTVLTQGLSPPCHVLVLEDDFFIRAEVLEFLDAEGVRAVGAGSIAEAKHQLEQDPNIGVVLVDLRLSDGVRLHRLYASRTARSHWPGVHCSYWER